MYVANLMDYAKQEDLKTDFPNISQVFQTPVVTLGEPGKPHKSAAGKKGRDLVAEALGLCTEEFNNQILVTSPQYNNPRTR